MKKNRYFLPLLLMPLLLQAQGMEQVIAPDQSMARQPGGQSATADIEQIDNGGNPGHDYENYIRPLDQLRTDLSNQQALLTLLLDVSTKIQQLRAQNSDILVLLDEELSQSERIRAVLSNAGTSIGFDELANLRDEMETLRNYYMAEPDSGREISGRSHQPWSLNHASINYVQLPDDSPGSGLDTAVSIVAGGDQVLIKLGQSKSINGKTIMLESVKDGIDGHIRLTFMVAGEATVIYY